MDAVISSYYLSKDTDFMGPDLAPVFVVFWFHLMPTLYAQSGSWIDLGGNEYLRQERNGRTSE